MNEEEEFLPGGFGELLRQAQAMQDQLAEAQAAAEHELYDGQAGGGAVTVTVDGTMQFRSVRITPEAVDPSDVGMLEDLVLAALHDAVEKVRAASFGVMGLPGAGAGAGGLGGLGGLGDILGGAGGLGGLGDLLAGGGGLSDLLGGAGGGLTELMGPLGDVLGELMGSGELEDLEAGGFLSAGELDEPDVYESELYEPEPYEPELEEPDAGDAEA